MKTEPLLPADIDARHLLAQALVPRLTRWVTVNMALVLAQSVVVGALCVAALLQPIQIIAVSESGKTFQLTLVPK